MKKIIIIAILAVCVAANVSGQTNPEEWWGTKKYDDKGNLLHHVSDEGYQVIITMNNGLPYIASINIDGKSPDINRTLSVKKYMKDAQGEISHTDHKVPVQTVNVNTTSANSVNITLDYDNEAFKIRNPNNNEITGHRATSVTITCPNVETVTVSGAQTVTIESPQVHTATIEGIKIRNSMTVVSFKNCEDALKTLTLINVGGSVSVSSCDNLETVIAKYNNIADIPIPPVGFSETNSANRKLRLPCTNSGAYAAQLGHFIGCTHWQDAKIIVDCRLPNDRPNPNAINRKWTNIDGAKCWSEDAEPEPKKSSGGKSVPNTQHDLMQKNPSTRTAPAGFELFATTISDNDGNYLFEDLPEGTYIIMVVLEGYDSQPSDEFVITAETGVISGIDFEVDHVNRTIRPKSTNGGGEQPVVCSECGNNPCTCEPAPVPDVPIFDRLAREYSVGAAPVPLKVKGKNSETLTVFKVNGETATEFNPDKAGVYLVEALSANGRLRIWRYVRVN